VGERLEGGVDKSTYAQIVHSRLNHVQTLLSAVCALEITLILGGIFGACQLIAANADVDTVKQAFKAGPVGMWTVFFLLLWGHVFCLYQFFVTRKAVKILASLEEEMGELKYFTDPPSRLFLYFCAHGLPSIVAFIAPIILSRYELMNGWQVLYAYFYFVAVSLGVWHYLDRGFFPEGRTK